MQIVLITFGAYLLGSVSFAIVVSRLMRLPDPRTFGSKNPGATNVLRTGRRLAAVLTLAGDAGKGWLAVWLADRYLGFPGATGLEVPLAGLAAFIGHLFPVFHRFQGGKGVATAAGVLVGFNPWLGLATVATWAVIAVFLRLSSLAALVSALFAPVYTWWLFGLRPVFPVVIALSVLLIWRHRENIARLLAGEEGRIGGKRKPRG